MLDIYANLSESVAELNLFLKKHLSHLIICILCNRMKLCHRGQRELLQFSPCFLISKTPSTNCAFRHADQKREVSGLVFPDGTLLNKEEFWILLF